MFYIHTQQRIIYIRLNKDLLAINYLPYNKFTNGGHITLPSVNLLIGRKTGLVTKLLSGSYLNMAANRESLARTISDAVSRMVSDAINSAFSQVSQNNTLFYLSTIFLNLKV